MTAKKAGRPAIAKPAAKTDKAAGGFPPIDSEAFSIRLAEIKANPENSHKPGESDDEYLARMGAVDVTGLHNGLAILFGLGRAKK